VGTDFHCSLLRKDGENLRPYLAFNIQIKSSNEAISIGGVTKGGNWRRHEIEKFCAQEVPFLIGIVNVDNQRLDLFSTTTRSFIGRWKNGLMPRRIDLIPYQPAVDRDINDGYIENLDEIPGMPREVWKLEIGNPIIQITISDSDDSEKREAIKQRLEPYLRLDGRNIVLAEMGLGYFEWPLIIRPDASLAKIGIGLWTRFPIDPVQLDSTIKMIASLLRAYHLGKQKEKIIPWIPVLEQFDVEKANPVIRDVIAQAVAFAKEGSAL
jgi:hypothetical protein